MRWLFGKRPPREHAGEAGAASDADKDEDLARRIRELV